jgi:hypothetical protein
MRIIPRGEPLAVAAYCKSVLVKESGGLFTELANQLSVVAIALLNSTAFADEQGLSVRCESQTRLLRGDVVYA